MLRRRWVLLCFVLLLVGGTLSATLAHGFYLRSGFYAGAVADHLTLFFGLPTDVGAVTPLDLRSRDLRDVVVWLPEKRGRVFHGRRIIWQPRRDGEAAGYELRIDGGAFLIDSESWGSEDYRLVLESGLGHDFSQLQLRQVEMRHLDLNWRAGNFALATRDAAGTVIFDPDGAGRASFLSTWLNDHQVEEPIHIYARFRSNPGVRIEHVTLDSPRIPFSALGLEDILCVKSPAGDFSGKITYREQDDSQIVELSGFVDGLRLEDLGELLPAVAPRGRISMQVDEGRIRDGRLEKLVFRGRIDEVDLAPLAKMLSLPDVGGRATLFVHEGEVTGRSVSWLGMSGSLDDVSLATLTGLIGHGRITGSLRVEMPSLVMSDNRIESAEFRFLAEPPADGPGRISRELLIDVVRQFAGITLPEFVPEQLEYTRLGARVLIDGDTLRVLGTHGPRNTTILTVKVFGREVGVLFQPARTFELQPLLDRIRAQADRVDVDKLREWWEPQPTGSLGPPP